MKKNITKQLLFTLAFLTIFSSIGITTAQAKKAKKVKEADLNGTYHASLGIQTATDRWIEHMGYYEKKNNSTYKTKNADKLTAKSKENPGELDVFNGEFTDVEIAGNGTYTLKLSGADFSGEKCISQLHIATDIPVNDNVKFNNISVKINGSEKLSFDEGVLEYQEPYLVGGMDYLLLNHWRPELIETLKTMGLSETSENSWDLLQGTGEENIEVTFTVSGFNYDNEAAQTEVSDNASSTDAENGTASNDTAGDTSNGNIENNASNNGTASTILIVAAIIILTVCIIVFAVRRKNQK